MTTETITIDTDQWAVVPRDLTKAQEYAGCMNGIGPGVSKEVYDVLIAAAPRPEPVQQVVTPELLWSVMRDALQNGSQLECEYRNNEDVYEIFSAKLDAAARDRADKLAAMLQQPAPLPAPAPIPTSERLPTEADADPWGDVAWYDDMRECWTISDWHTPPRIYDRFNSTHWQPTGLQRPPAPGDSHE